MRSLPFVTILFLAACSGADERLPDVPPDAMVFEDACPQASSSCNIVDQLGCNAGERCTFYFDAEGTPLDLTACNGEDEAGAACVPSGTIAIGDACAIDPGSYDDCVGGSFCLDGFCRAYCVVTPDSCDTGAGETCQVIAPDNSPVVGGCVPPA